LGEYIAKIYDEIKGRPSYRVAETVGGDVVGQESSEAGRTWVATGCRT